MTSEHEGDGPVPDRGEGPIATAVDPDERADDASGWADETSSPAPSQPRPSRGASAAIMCPFLATGSGAWRAAFPVSEHRCTAVVPAVRIAPAKQRRLCLSIDHITCTTYLAAVELRGATGAGRDDGRPAGKGRRRAIPSTTPVLLERPRPALPVPATMQRGVGQIILVGLLAVAFVAVFFARLGSTPAASPSPSASPPAIASASPSRAPSPSPTASASPSPSISPSAAPSPTRTPRQSARPSPSASPVPASGTYTVKSGDTLSGIAAQFGTTVKAIRDLNGLTSNVIHPGQVLKIP
jgi:LysM repeat protein